MKTLNNTCANCIYATTLEAPFTNVRVACSRLIPGTSDEVFNQLEAVNNSITSFMIIDNKVTVHKTSTCVNFKAIDSK